MNFYLKPYEWVICYTKNISRTVDHIKLMISNFAKVDTFSAIISIIFSVLDK